MHPADDFAPPTPAEIAEERLKALVTLAFIVSCTTGFFADGLSLWVLAIIVVTGVACGLWRGYDLRSRALYTVPFLVGCFGVVFSTSAYVEGRKQVWNYEILLPVFIGAAPAVAVYLLIDKWLLPRLIHGPRPKRPF